MTCIVGSIDNGTIYMGGDSAGVAGYSIQRRADCKVFVSGDFIMGFTSSFRMGQILQYSFTPPIMKENQDLFAYMATDFADGIRDCLKAGGYARINSNEESGGTFLVGYKGRLFTIEDDFQISEQLENYAAVGCGQDIALGSMFSTKGQPIEQRIRTALEAAEEYSAGVRGPFNILKLGG